MKRNQEIEISNEIIEKLKEKGFRIHKYYSKTTKSIYLKIDFGVCYGIRISDHKGKKKYKYRFNLIKQYKGPKQVVDDGDIRLFYNYNNIGELIKDIQNEKISRIKKYGIYNYRKFMKINARNDLYSRFQKVA